MNQVSQVLKSDSSLEQGNKKKVFSGQAFAFMKALFNLLPTWRQAALLVFQLRGFN